jgi:hypothetical protein
VPQAAPVLADRLALIIEALCHAVARRVGLGGLAGPLIILIASRLRRLAARFTRRATATPAHREASRPARPRQRAWVPLYPPRRFAWLLRLAPEVAPIAAQLRHLLTEPDMAVLLAAIPELRRTLRPLCQMLGIRPAPSPPAPSAPARAASCHPMTAQPPIPPPAMPRFALPLRLSSTQA